MAGKKDFRALEKRLVRLGFTYSHTNSGQFRVYRHGAHPEVAINPGISDGAARVLLRKIEKALGELRKAPKRNAAAIKERAAAERERQAAEIDRLNIEREAIIRERDSLLSGAGASLTNAQIRALEERVAQIESERRQIERLMNAPVVGSHDTSRTVRHQAGVRRDPS